MASVIDNEWEDVGPASNDYDWEDVGGNEKQIDLTAQKPSMLQNVGSVVESMSPMNMGNTAYKFVKDMYDFGGERAAEKIATKFPRINPKIPAAIGTGISMVPDIAQAAIGMNPGKFLGEVPAPEPLFNKTTNVMQRFAGKGINKAAGIKPSTVKYMAGKENPADYGAKLARSLQDEGGFGMTARNTFNKASAVKESFGNRIGETISKLERSGVSTSVPADEALNPLVNTWAELKDSALTANQRSAAPFEQIYGKLVKQAQAKGGQLGLDDLRNAMDEVGSALERAGEGTPLESAYSRLYGTLAKVRKGLVERIAGQAGNPQLSQELLSANEGFTRYSRIMPDIGDAAAKSSVSSTGFHPLDAAKEYLRPPMSKLFMKAGNSLQKTPNSIFGAGLILGGNRLVNSGENKLKKYADSAQYNNGKDNATGNSKHKPLFTSSPSENQQNSKPITESIARSFMKAAKAEGLTGEEAKNRARQLAKEAGYKWKP